MTDSFECPSCAMDVAGNRSDYETCPYCGYEFPRQKTSYTLMAILLLVLMALFALYLM